VDGQKKNQTVAALAEDRILGWLRAGKGGCASLKEGGGVDSSVGEPEGVTEELSQERPLVSCNGAKKDKNLKVLLRKKESDHHHVQLEKEK